MIGCIEVSAAMLPFPAVTDADKAFPVNAVKWVPDTIIPREAWVVGHNAAKMPDGVPTNPAAAERYAHYNDIFHALFFGSSGGSRGDLYILPRNGLTVRDVWDALCCILGCRGFSQEHKTAAWVFAADEWTLGMWFADSGPPAHLVAPEERPMRGTNPQVRWLLEQQLVSLELAIEIEDECGDKDVGLFLGQLLSSGKTTPHVLHAFLAHTKSQA